MNRRILAMAAVAALASSIRSRPRRYRSEAIRLTQKASTATHACGTWKKTIRADSPLNPLAAGA